MPDNSETPALFSPRHPLDNEQALRDWLGQLSTQHTGKRVAQAAGISPSRLSSIIHGRASIGPGLLARFGYRCVRSVAYIPLLAIGADAPAPPVQVTKP